MPSDMCARPSASIPRAAASDLGLDPGSVRTIPHAIDLRPQYSNGCDTVNGDTETYLCNCHCGVTSLARPRFQH